MDVHGGGQKRGHDVPRSVRSARLDARPEPDGGPATPGSVLRRQFLDPSGISEGAFARHIGVGLPQLSRLLHGHTGLSERMALGIAAATGTQAEAWMALHAVRRLWLHRQRRKKPAAGVMPGLRGGLPPQPGTNQSPTIDSAASASRRAAVAVQRGAVKPTDRDGSKKGPGAGTLGDLTGEADSASEE